jgi:S-ribosylhomocysteine lyase
MGCQTGFYVVTWLGDFDAVEAVFADVLGRIVEADEVPYANLVRCGWAENHSLAGAQRKAAELLEMRAQWRDVGQARVIGD